MVASLSFGLPLLSRWCGDLGLLVCNLHSADLYRGPPPLPFPVSLASVAWIFSHLFFMLLSNTFLETLWAPKNEYSCELGPQNDYKMEAKIEEKSNFAKK